MARLKEKYKNETAKALMEKFKYKNVMEIPKLEKIVVNMGVGDAKENSKILNVAADELSIITGQLTITICCGLLKNLKILVSIFKYSHA